MDDTPGRPNGTSSNEKEVRVASDDHQHQYDEPPPKHKQPWRSKTYAVLSWTPPRCRYDPDKPFQFSMSLNILFAFAGCFTVANLYYNHPILNLFAHDFNVSNEQASYIPTMAQAGYAAGLLLLCPLGDLIKRRPFVLWLVWFTATMWIGLCVTHSFSAFLAISFITGITTVTPQLMLPLVGDLAPPNRRSTCLSIVVSGMLLGMLLARLLSGVVARFIGWRYIYWISFALQYLILILLYFFMPDYPSTNPDHSHPKAILKRYPTLLIDIVRLTLKHPVLAQACLIGFLTSATFTSYWTTLTFLLSSPPYNYSSLVIGLFAVIGIAAMTFGPIYARTVMEHHPPLFSVIIGEIICLTGIIIGTYTGKHSVAGPIIQAALLDMGLQTSQIANRTAIYKTEPKKRNRVNTAYMVSVFCGQLMGTAVGNRLYAEGGWVVSGSASVGFVGLALLLCFVRGPREKRWVGWKGGWSWKKDEQEEGGAMQPETRDEEKGAGLEVTRGAEAEMVEKGAADVHEQARDEDEGSSQRTLSGGARGGEEKIEEIKS